MKDFYNYLRDGKVLTPEEIQRIALTAWAENQLEVSALANPDRFAKFGDLAGAVLMLKEYHDNQYLIDRNNWHVVSIEQGFGLRNEVLLTENSRVVVYWVGKPDLTVVEGHRLEPVDHKTVENIDGLTISRYKPSSQMIGYVHSCEVIARSLGLDVKVDRCVVNICARTRPSDNPRNGRKRPRFVRAYPNFTREEINEWKRNVIAKCERIAHNLTSNEWSWCETSCFNIYHRTCDFLKFDAVTPSARDAVLFADYQEGEPWRPYNPKEDED